MPTKILDSQADRNGDQKIFKFGGGENTINANDDLVSGFGYIINGGGGNDSIFGSDYDGPGDGSGDPLTQSGDLLIGGNGSDFIVGGLGDDHIFGGNQDGTDGGKGKDGVAFNTLFGDAQGSSLTFVGGNDVITGGNDSTNVMFGDVQSVGGTFTGGNDILIGGDNAVSQIGIAGTLFTAGNLMIGDGFSGGSATSVGGNDTLVSGQNSDDAMIGDFGTDNGAVGGEDTFVFGTSNGNDTIADFRSTDDDSVGDTADLIGDKVRLESTGLTWSDLDTNGNVGLDDGDAHVSVSGATTVIDLGQAIDDTATAGVDTITFQNLDVALIETDFVFA